jgi:hypothetical protein
MAILAGKTDWLHSVYNPEKYTLDQSLDLVGRARELFPRIEVKLAKILAPLKFTTEQESRFALRVLEVLERSPDSSTALPALRLLSQCPNARVRSKAALLIGRIIRNPQWANKGATESDPRVSANAVESLWGLKTPAAREAFLSAAMNQHHRIAMNGIVGLYLMGEPASIPFLFHLSRSENPLARASAAWAMGHLEDPRFLPRLSRLMEDADPTTRKRAFRSLSRIRHKMSRLRATGTLHVQIRDCECHREAHLIRLGVAKEGQLLSNLDLRQFLVWSGQDLVEEFSSAPPRGESPYYEITYQGPLSSTNLVKVQVYAASGVGEDTGFERTF